MLALALVLEGSSREAACRHGPADRARLGPPLQRRAPRRAARPAPSAPPPRLTPEQLTELARSVEDGPDPATDGVVRWRRVDLQVVIAHRFGVQLHQRSVGKVPRRLGFARLAVRPKHPSSEPEAQAAYK